MLPDNYLGGRSHNYSLVWRLVLPEYWKLEPKLSSRVPERKFLRAVAIRLPVTGSNVSLKVSFPRKYLSKYCLIVVRRYSKPNMRLCTYNFHEKLSIS